MSTKIRNINDIDKFILHAVTILVNQNQKGFVDPNTSSEILEDLLAQLPLQADEQSIKALKMASFLAFQNRSQPLEKGKTQQDLTIFEKNLLKGAHQRKLDVIDLLQSFIYLEKSDSLGKLYLLEFSLRMLFFCRHARRWEEEISSNRIDQRQDKTLNDIRLSTREKPSLPDISLEELEQLTHITETTKAFEACLQILAKYGPFTLYSPKENLSEMKAKQLSKKIYRIAEPYTWKENAKLFADKLAFAMVNPKHPPLMVLHGTSYMRLEDCTKEITKLFKKDGYQSLTIDGRRFSARHEEPYPLFGSPSVWSGSRPGLLTSFVYDNPKSLIIIKDADKMNPVMFQTLAGAFKNNNIIEDEYGLENRDRDRREMAMPATPVDFSNTVFILTTSAGSHLYERPDISEFSQHLLESRAFAGLESSMFTPSGKSTSDDPTFSSEFLDLMRNGFTPMPPLDIKTRLNHCAPQFSQQLKSQAKALEYSFKNDRGQIKKITAALLLSERHNKRSFEDLATEIVRPVFMKGNKEKTLSLKISKEAEEILSPYLEMDQPQSYLQKRGKTLTPVFELQDSAYVLTDLKVEKIFRQKDHEGSVRLLADYPKTRFKDIFGHQKIKEKLQEIIGLLKVEKNDEAQRGILLAGEPGVGKTMMAEAFAGEAQMAFVNITGSELLYANAAERLQEILEKHSPCVVFIDEADSIPSRASNSEFAPAVNRLLAMIQGINTDSNQAFWILATNYPERLDAALLRAGRIEDTLHMRPPRDFKARTEYLQHFPLTEKQREILARISIGFTGAMFEQLYRKTKRLKNLKKRITKEDLYQLVIEIQHGDDMNSRPATEEYERCTAYHEAGHAVAQLCLGVNTAHLMLVLHNGEAVSGYLQTIDEEIRDRTPTSVEKDLIVYLAGRGAEELIFGEATMGCSSDLKRAGELAYYAASKVGFMPEKTGLYISPLNYKSEDVEKNYEQAAAAMIEEAWAKTQTLLAEKEPLLREIAEKLIKKRLLDNDELRKMHKKFEQAEEENTHGA